MGAWSEMFERFTDRARRVVVGAHQEARLLKHNSIGTEHLLLGLLREGEGVAARALESLGVSLDGARDRIREVEGEGGAESLAGRHIPIPFTPRAKKVLELSLREALQLGHNYIGTEHILLGLVAEGDGVAVRVLADLGADTQRVRQQVTATKALRSLGRESTPIPLPLGGPSGGARAQIAGLYARLDAVEARLSTLSAELDRLRQLLTQHGIEASRPDSDPGAGQGGASVS